MPILSERPPPPREGRNPHVGVRGPNAGGGLGGETSGHGGSLELPSHPNHSSRHYHSKLTQLDRLTRTRERTRSTDAQHSLTVLPSPDAAYHDITYSQPLDCVIAKERLPVHIEIVLPGVWPGLRVYLGPFLSGKLPGSWACLPPWCMLRGGPASRSYLLITERVFPHPGAGQP